MKWVEDPMPVSYIRSIRGWAKSRLFFLRRECTQKIGKNVRTKYIAQEKASFCLLFFLANGLHSSTSLVLDKIFYFRNIVLRHFLGRQFSKYFYCCEMRAMRAIARNGQFWYFPAKIPITRSETISWLYRFSHERLTGERPDVVTKHYIENSLQC